MINFRGTLAQVQAKPLAAIVVIAVAVMLARVGALPAIATAQQPASAALLVFDGVTVVDVEQGKLISNQRVVISGDRIQAVGDVSTVKVPGGAQVVPSHGKYLIPGLWDMHVHPDRGTEAAYPLFLAHGVTGVRDAGSSVPLDTLLLWRREILAGTRIGPPRQVLSGQAIFGPEAGCARNDQELRSITQTCVADAADAVRYVDSLKAAGADMVKPREVDRALYFAIAAEARRIGLPFGGHTSFVTELEASDSGATIIDHAWGDAGCAYDMLAIPPESLATLMGLPATAQIVRELRRKGNVAARFKGLKSGDAEWETCQQRAAERFRQNGTWFVPTFFEEPPEARHRLSDVWRRASMPLLAGTDDQVYNQQTWGASLHRQLVMYVTNGLTPLNALQSATLNAARALRATDSLGTIAPGKLADLVLLDADPLADIAHTMAIRAVVANGRYYDRVALDGLLAEVQAKAKAKGLAP